MARRGWPSGSPWGHVHKGARGRFLWLDYPRAQLAVALRRRSPPHHQQDMFQVALETLEEHLVLQSRFALQDMCGGLE